MSPHIILEVLPVLIFNALEITGFYTATWYKQEETDAHIPDEGSKMALWWVKFYCLRYIGEFWSKPICTCPPCMASLHSLWYWLFFPFTAPYIIMYVFYILVLCGTMKLISVKFEL